MKRSIQATILALILALSTLLSVPLKAQQPEPAALVEKGDQLLLESDFAGAEEAYNTAITANPEYAPAYAHRCYLRTYQQQYEDAVADCQQAITLAPENAEGYIYLTRAYDWNGEYDKAVEVGEQAIQLAPDSGLAHSFLGAAYLDLERLEEGEREVRLGVEFAPETAEVHRNLAFFYGLNGDVESQLSELKEAARLAPNFAPYLKEIASLLNRIGAVYSKQGRYDLALDPFQLALTIMRQVGDRAGEGTTLNNIGGVYLNKGRYDLALEQFQKALTIKREIGDRAGEAATLNNIGGVYYKQERYDLVLEQFHKALQIIRKVGDQTFEGTMLNSIGTVYWNQGRYDLALEQFQQALEIRRQVGDRAGEDQTLNNIGAVYHQQRRYNLALEQYQQILTIKRKLGDRAGEGTTLSSIGTVYDDQGRYDLALERYQQALTIIRQVGDLAVEGATLNNIGTVYLNQGRYDLALEQYQQALEIIRQVGDRAVEGTTLGSIGTVYSKQGRYELALEQYQQALEIIRQVGNRADEGAALSSIGAVYSKQGHYDLALEQYQQALDISREVGDRAGEGQTLNNIGAIYRQQRRYDLALKQYQQALEIRRQVGDQAGEGQTLNNVGIIYEQQNDSTKALAYYSEAMTVLEFVRAVAGSEVGRADFIAQYAHLYDRTVKLHHQEGQDADAFFTSERGRARSFLDSLVSGRVKLSDNENQALLDKEREAYAQRQAIKDELARAGALEPPNLEYVEELEEQLENAQRAYTEALDAIEARDGQLAGLVPDRENRHLLGVPAVQELLNEQTTLVSYHLYDKEEALAFVITRDEFVAVTLPISRSAVIEKITLFHDFASLDDSHPSDLKLLHEWLIGPLASHLNTPALTIVPHGVLHYLPFAALHDGETYLMDEYVLSILPSASVLPFVQQNAANKSVQTGWPLVLGHPETTQSGLKPLPFAEQEAQAIADFYDTQPLLGQAATESAVREQASEANILHLAAHGKYNRINPLDSTIYLTPENAPTAEPDDSRNGLLQVYEVYDLDLAKTDLVVLSACQAQVGELSAGDDITGLTRAFLFAETPTVIATLWHVDDEATARLMERFYTHLREGKGKAEALRQAQIDVRKEKPHPYYWAAFVLSGDAGQISPTTPTTGTWTWLLIGGTLLLLLAGIKAFGWHRQANKTRKNP